MLPLRSLVLGLTLALLVVPTTARAQDEADYYGDYDLFFGNMPAEMEESGIIGRWTASEFVVLQGGTPTIRVEMSIDTDSGELRMWDSSTSDVLCATEGVYEFEDDGETITLELVSDPCAGRAESADGARLIRRPSAES